MSYIVTICTEGKEISFNNKTLDDAIVKIANDAETVEGFEDGKTEIKLRKKIITPLPARADKGK